jgi:cytochrome P450
MTDSAEGKDKAPERLSHKVLFLCLASIHTSTMSICHALFDLCYRPEYVEPLREEIKQAMAEEGGLTLSAINKMKRLDSFLKESQRLNHPGSC